MKHISNKLIIFTRLTLSMYFVAIILVPCFCDNVKYQVDIKYNGIEHNNTVQENNLLKKIIDYTKNDKTLRLYDFDIRTEDPIENERSHLAIFEKYNISKLVYLKIKLIRIADSQLIGSFIKKYQSESDIYDDIKNIYTAILELLTKSEKSNESLNGK